MNSPRSVAFAAIAVVLLASCSSDSGESTTEPVASSSTTAQASTTPPPATTEAPSATSTTPSSTTTSPPATTDAPTDTSPSLFEPGTPEFEVDETISILEQQWKECLRTLPNCDPLAASALRTGDDNAAVQGTALRWNRETYRTSNIDALSYRVDQVVIDIAAGTASVVLCVTDPVILMEADGTVVDDKFYTSIQDWELELVDGVWKSSNRTIRGEAVVGEENDLCVA